MSSYKEMMKQAKEFYDTIDFEPFFAKYEHISCVIPFDDVYNDIEEYYDKEHPELLPKDFRGWFFNYMNMNEFVEYLQKRYNFKVQEETVTHYYLIRS